MGGKALKNTYTERKNTTEFKQIATEIQKQLATLGLESHVVKCYHTKKTHGDLDLLLKMNQDFRTQNINLRHWVEDTFQPHEIHNNGGVISFDYNQFQVDFIPVRQSNWEIAKDFFDYDPTGNLMGKIAKRFSFHLTDNLWVKVKYGFEGLIIEITSPAFKKEITLSKDSQTIFNFLGLNYQRYLKGFETKEDIFQYIINSKYFDPSVFQMENLRHVDRKRNKKRATYQDFLKVLPATNPYDKFNLETKADHLAYFQTHFPHMNFDQIAHENQQKAQENEEIKTKFNGKLIMEWIPDLKGKELGTAISEFQKTKKDFRQYALKFEAPFIKTDFLSWYHKVYNRHENKNRI
jgi:hypothetical protein